MYKEEKRERRDTMQKEEFEDLVGQALSDRDYEIIETACLYHPAIRDTSGVEEVAELYKSFGMTIFYDMIGRAKKNQDLEIQLHQAQAEVDRFKEEMVQNRAAMGLDYSRMLDECKRLIVRKLKALLQCTRAGSGVKDLILNEKEKCVTIVYECGSKQVNVEADSGIALIRDVIRSI